MPLLRIGVAARMLRCMSPAYTPSGAFNIHSDIARDPGTPNENGHFQMFLGSTSCKEEATVAEDNIVVPEEALEQVQGLGLRVHQSGTESYDSICRKRQGVRRGVSGFLSKFS